MPALNRVKVPRDSLLIHEFVHTHYSLASVQLKSVQSALSDLKRPPERLQSQCNYRPFIT